MEVTFGAAGDFISVVVIIKDIVNVLNDSRGSTRDFQELTQSLKVMEKALEQLHRIFDDTQVPNELGSLQSIALDTARQVTCRLTEFRQKINKYSASLAHNGTGNAVKDAMKKIQWRLEEGDVTKFRGEIAGYTASLEILLHAVTMQLVKCNQMNMQRYLSLMEARTTATINQQAQSLHDLLGQFMNRVSLVLQTVSSIGDELKLASNRIATIGSVIYGELRGLRSLFMRLERPFVEEHFTLEDAIGRQIPIHLRAITSWDVFEHIIREQFKGRIGENRVVRRRYTLQDHATHKELSSSTPWSRAFRAYQKVNMSILCKEMLNDSNSSLTTSCPSCHYVSPSGKATEIQCENCNMFYTRVIEIEEIDSEEHNQHTDGQKFGEPSSEPLSTVEHRSHSKRKRGLRYGTNFEKSHPQKRIRSRPRGRQRDSAETRVESESESDENDINGLVRVRLISKQRKMNSRRAFVMDTSSRSKDLTSVNPSEPSKLASPHPPTKLPSREKPHRDQVCDEACETEDAYARAAENENENREENGSTMAYVPDFENRYLMHGREFQRLPTQYWGPIDQTQQECYDIAHHILKMVQDNRLFEAPLGNKISEILDVGTGTGDWAIEMADKYPSANVMGWDISAIQPELVPPNCHFIIDDAQLDWMCTEESLDFVHIRALYGGISDWPQLYREAYRMLVPAGWIEHLEFDITPYSEVQEIMDDEDHIFKQWSKVLLEAMDRTGKTGRIGMDGNIRKHLQVAGFTDIVEKNYHVPCGPWARDPKQKEIGLINLAFMDQSLEGFALFLLKEIMGWEYLEIKKLIARIRSALRDTKNRVYFLVTNVYAKRPECQL